MNTRKAARRTVGESANGRSATGSVRAMRATVSAFGRFTTERPAPSGEGLQHHLAHGLERLEHAIALEGDPLEVRGAFDPFATGKLLDQKLTGVVRVGERALLRPVLH